jgi:DNA-binding MarR family transcriptional regulator
VASDRLESDEKGVAQMWREISAKWRNVHRAVEENMEGAGFSLLEFNALLGLHHKGQLPMVTFAKDLGVTSAAVTGIIDRLESKGFVERIRGKEDRRVVRIAITAWGEQAFEKAKGVHERLVQRLLVNLDDEDLDRLLEIYSKLENAASGLKVGGP